MTRASSRSRSILAAVAIVASAVAVLPALSWAHAVVFPRTSASGAYEKYVLRVPNEKAVATTRVEIRFPAGLRVTSFADVPGWKLELLTDSAKAIVGAIWTGNLPPQRFAEFPFVAANPKTDTRLEWPAYQTYADGERVEWTGPEGSKSPASITMIAAAAAPAAAAPSSPPPTPAGSNVPRWVPWTAFALSLVSLGLAMRKPESRA